MKGTKEFYEMQDSFEKLVKSRNCPIYIGSEIVRAAKDSKHFYENGRLNDAFLMYMAGYSNAKCEYQNQ